MRFNNNAQSHVASVIYIARHGLDDIPSHFDVNNSFIRPISILHRPYPKRSSEACDYTLDDNLWTSWSAPCKQSINRARALHLPIKRAIKCSSRVEKSTVREKDTMVFILLINIMSIYCIWIAWGFIIFFYIMFVTINKLYWKMKGIQNSNVFTEFKENNYQE